MKIAIVGVGAIGSYLACKLSQSGAELSVVVRKTRGATIREQGISMTTEKGETLRAHPQVIEGAGSENIHDCIFVCVKAYAVPDVVSSIAPLIGPATRVAFIQNGIPWWYRIDNASGPNLLDPGARLATTVALDRVIGGVAYVNVRNIGPGRAHHVSDDTYVLGQPDGRITAPLEQIASVMRAGAIDVRLTERIQQEIWLKLWGSLAFNPISALTRATMDRIISDETTRPVVVAMMSEARAIAEKAGITFDLSVEQRLEAAARAGAFKTSMLQDLEAGRQMEIDAILGAVAAVARQLRIETPTIDTVLGLLTQKAVILGLR